MIRVRSLSAAAAALLLPAAAAAADCAADKPRDELAFEDAQAVYDCLSAAMHEGYMAGPKLWIPEAHVRDYRAWTKASVLPADPGVHGGRFLLTYVSEPGAEAYLAYDDEAQSIPAGTVIAKESFTIDEQGVGAAGPLFIMEKVAQGASPETGGWHYMMVAPDGTPQAVPVMTACHECHSAYEGSDGLGYPVEEVRIAR